MVAVLFLMVMFLMVVMLLLAVLQPTQRLLEAAVFTRPTPLPTELELQTAILLMFTTR